MKLVEHAFAAGAVSEWIFVSRSKIPWNHEYFYEDTTAVNSIGYPVVPYFPIYAKDLESLGCLAHPSRRPKFWPRGEGRRKVGLFYAEVPAKAICNPYWPDHQILCIELRGALDDYHNPVLVDSIGRSYPIGAHEVEAALGQQWEKINLQRNYERFWPEVAFGPMPDPEPYDGE